MYDGCTFRVTNAIELNDWRDDSSKEVIRRCEGSQNRVGGVLNDFRSRIANSVINDGANVRGR